MIPDIPLTVKYVGECKNYDPDILFTKQKDMYYSLAFYSSAMDRKKSHTGWKDLYNNLVWVCVEQYTVWVQYNKER